MKVLFTILFLALHVSGLLANGLWVLSGLPAGVVQERVLTEGEEQS